MSGYKAMLFDLDDTLLDRNRAVDKMFCLVLEKCYEDVEHSVQQQMLKKFKAYNKRDHGYSDKTNVLESFFDEFPPKYRLPPATFKRFGTIIFRIAFR